MKPIVSILAVMALCSAAQANLVVNGDFESDPQGTGWTEWWDSPNSDIGDHATEYGGTAGLNREAVVYWNDSGYFQDIPINTPGIYRLSGSILTNSQFPLVDGRIARLSAEVGDGPGVNWWQVNLELTDAATPDTYFPMEALIDLTDPVNTNVRINLYLVDTAGPASGTGYFDNISLELVPEPATLSLLGLGGLALIRRHRNH